MGSCPSLLIVYVNALLASSVVLFLPFEFQSPLDNHVLLDSLNARKSLREKSKVSKSMPRNTSNEDGLKSIVFNTRSQTRQRTAEETSAESNISAEADDVSSLYSLMTISGLHFLPPLKLNL